MLLVVFGVGGNGGGGEPPRSPCNLDGSTLHASDNRHMLRFLIIAGGEASANKSLRPGHPLRNNDVKRFIMCWYWIRFHS